MAIKIETNVSIDSKPRISFSKSTTSKKGIFYPDTLEIKYIDLFSYDDEEGNPKDGEMHYLIKVDGSATTADVVSRDVLDLNKLLHSFDYKKYPLQMSCELFVQGSTWSQEVKQFVSNRVEKETKCITSAKELLAKLKK